MKALGFRQANAWLHTWVGLLLGWLLYAIFLTGTLSFFQDEISFWMQPEQHASMAQPDTAVRVIEQMQTLAPNAAVWNINLPSERNSAVRVQWFEQGERQGKGGGQRRVLDATSAEPINVRETRGGGFLYRFHFELYGMPRIVARWIVGIATLVMLVAIVSGVITHKKIFKDFFTFRPRKGQRSWLDAHNVTAVLALPFHLMITYSGLLLLMFMLMPWGIESAYRGDAQAFFAESGGRGGGGRNAGSEAAPGSDVQVAPLTDLRPLLEIAEQHWPRGTGSVQVSQPGTADAVIELREHGGDSLIDRGSSERLRFNGVTGEQLNGPVSAPISGANATYNVLTSLHLLRFAGAPLRWAFFVSGLLGTAMIVTGMVLWVNKRLPERQKLGRTPFGHRLVEILNVATLAGLPLAIAAYFWANRLLPAALNGRVEWEIRCFFAIWLVSLLHALSRPHRRAWVEQLGANAVLFAALPLFALLLPNSHVLNTLGRGQWLVAGVDLTLWAFAAVFAGAAWKVATHRPTVRAPRRSVACTDVKELAA
ncbi:PepSY domain-containing protein [Pseudomonas stutzeri]|uniref:PepSY-associated TM helix domain-containing protein n=1 Tax=Stutzerimonas stutzeri TaxID=316 RepID=UPI00210D8D0E|nr:PepSY-associated TM helix domain-containing protein [Stutzerimonas stutzeri]MCQ4289352.1 PepSY domain-containing protein [Stutzerimonas stutzeri]